MEIKKKPVICKQDWVLRNGDMEYMGYYERGENNPLNLVFINAIYKSESLFWDIPEHKAVYIGILPVKHDCVALNALCKDFYEERLKRDAKNY